MRTLVLRFINTLTFSAPRPHASHSPRSVILSEAKNLRQWDTLYGMSRFFASLRMTHLDSLYGMSRFFASLRMTHLDSLYHMSRFFVSLRRYCRLRDVWPCQVASLRITRTVVRPKTIQRLGIRCCMCEYVSLARR